VAWRLPNDGWWYRWSSDPCALPEADADDDADDDDGAGGPAEGTRSRPLKGEWRSMKYGMRAPAPEQSMT